jgi:hypothetical protein
MERYEKKRDLIMIEKKRNFYVKNENISQIKKIEMKSEGKKGKSKKPIFPI